MLQSEIKSASFWKSLRFDRLDWISLAGIVVLAICITGLAAVQPSGGRAGKKRPSRQELVEQGYFSPELARRLELAQNLLAGNNLDKAETLITGLVAEYPFEGRAYMALGDLRLRQLRPVAAMLAFREAVDLNPDFLDQKTELFQGRKIKTNLEEVRKILDRGLAARPGDPELLEQRRIFYYVQRRLAGSCG